MGCCFGKKNEDTENKQKADERKAMEEGRAPQQQGCNNPDQPPANDHEAIERYVSELVQHTKPLPVELDLHGWQLKDVDAVMPLYLNAKPEDDICFIPGRGLHAASGKPTIKPHILELFQNEGLDHYIHHSGGRVTVNFNKGKKVVRKFKEGDVPIDQA